MKIGVLTLPFNNNYGGYLQAYALMTVLKQQGHEVELIYRQHNKRKISWKYYVKNVAKLFLGRPYGPWNPTNENILRAKGKHMMPFVDKYIVPRTKVLQSSAELKQAVEQGNYDVIICGSDQLWRPDYVQNVEDFFLSFVNGDKPKLVSYAASFGTDNPIYSDEQRKVCGDAIARFVAVSVREQSGINVIKQFGWKTKTEPQVVLDPTMLLPKEHYESLLLKAPSPSKGKVFCYVLDQSAEAQTLITKVCEKTKCDPYYIIDSENWKQQDYLMPSVEDWLSGIRDAEYVVTDSFHGTVFCIIFNKPFVVYANKDRGKDRFDNLLSLFDLLHRNNTNIFGKSETIDWDSVNEILKEQIKQSSEYLFESL